MLIVLENYALAVIGDLPPAKEDRVRAIVTRVFGGGDDWRATVRKTMGWPPTVDTEILLNWDRFQNMAKQEGNPASTDAFARSFADEFAKF
ncbi:MAG: hypothetical protein SFW67_37515 [Myxococcaceae bacterium]|nr:hypothetical protein [Myxococcaceae bacterium]